MTSSISDSIATSIPPSSRKSKKNKKITQEEVQEAKTETIFDTTLAKPVAETLTPPLPAPKPLSERSLRTICTGNNYLAKRYYEEILETDPLEAQKLRPYIEMHGDNTFYAIEEPLQKFLEENKLTEAEFILTQYLVPGYQDYYRSNLCLSYIDKKDFESARRVAYSISEKREDFFETEKSADGKLFFPRYRDRLLRQIKEAQEGIAEKGEIKSDEYEDSY